MKNHHTIGGLRDYLDLVRFAVNAQTGSGMSPAPAFHWRCEAGNAVFNHNPARIFDDGAMVLDSVPYAKDYTMIIVYKPVSSGETMLWQMYFADSSMRGLTTERILSDSISIRYAENTSLIPVINTLRQSSPDSTSPYVRLAVGGDSAAKVAEVLC